MEIREILDTIDSDPKMDEELQREILETIQNIANADKIVDGLEEKIEQHKSELSEKELKYIINKCIAYKNVFYKFRNGKIVEYDQLNEITKRIFELENGIRNNDFSVWKQELLAYKGSKEDKEEDKMLKNMLMVIPEESNVVDKVTRMFKRAMWKFQQKLKEKHKNDDEQEVIELPQTTNSNIDINIDDDFKDKIDYEQEEIEEDNIEEAVDGATNEENEKEDSEEKAELETTQEVEQPLEDSIENEEINETASELEKTVNEEVKNEVLEEDTISEDISKEKEEALSEPVVEEPKKRTRKGSGSTTARRTRKGNQQSTNIEEEQEKK